MEEAAAADDVIILDQSRLLMRGRPCMVFSPENASVLHGCGLGLPWPLSLAAELAQAGLGHLGQPLTGLELADAVTVRLGGAA